MLHARLVVHRLELDGRDVPLRHGSLVAVTRAESGGTDWEVVADRVHAHPVDPGRVAVGMLCITGANDAGQLVLGELSGEAVVVRAVDRALVLRGDGPLAGLTLDLLGG